METIYKERSIHDWIKLVDEGRITLPKFQNR